MASAEGCGRLRPEFRFRMQGTDIPALICLWFFQGDVFVVELCKDSHQAHAFRSCHPLLDRASH